MRHLITKTSRRDYLLSYLQKTIIIICGFLSPYAFSHGGVTLINDVCVISLGNLSAHFAAYQPETRQSREYCEDLPDVANSIFVIDFMHDILSTMPVDFRIVRDVQNFGLAATWEDIQAIPDLHAASVYYAEPTQYINGSMNIDYTFNSTGTYIGVIAAHDISSAKVYRAVFPFRVGAKDFWDYLPYFIALLIALEAFYWMSGGGVSKFVKKNEQIKTGIF
jgi:hypothetical protein